MTTRVGKCTSAAILAGFECRVVSRSAGFARNCGARYEPAVGRWSPAYTTWTPPYAFGGEAASHRDLFAAHSSLREKRVYDTDVIFRWLRCRNLISTKRLRAVLPLDAPTWAGIGWVEMASGHA